MGLLVLSQIETCQKKRQNKHRLALLKTAGASIVMAVAMGACAPGGNTVDEGGGSVQSYNSPALRQKPGKDTTDFTAWSANVPAEAVRSRIEGFISTFSRNPGKSTSLGQIDACIPSSGDKTISLNERKANYKWGPSAQQLAAAVTTVAQIYQIDPLALTAVMAHESQFCPWGVSFSGAVGLTQFTGAGIAEVHWQLGATPTQKGVFPVPAPVVQSTSQRFATALTALGLCDSTDPSVPCRPSNGTLSNYAQPGVLNNTLQGSVVQNRVATPKEVACDTEGALPCQTVINWVSNGNVSDALKARIGNLEKKFAVLKGKQYRILPNQFRLFGDYRIQVVYAATLLRRNLLINQQEYCTVKKLPSCDKKFATNEFLAMYLGAWEQYNGSPSDAERTAYPKLVNQALNLLLSDVPG